VVFFNKFREIRKTKTGKQKNLESRSVLVPKYKRPSGEANEPCA
jgi:hypothetical protein